MTDSTERLDRLEAAIESNRRLLASVSRDLKDISRTLAHQSSDIRGILAVQKRIEEEDEQ